MKKKKLGNKYSTNPIFSYFLPNSVIEVVFFFSSYKKDTSLRISISINSTQVISTSTAFTHTSRKTLPILRTLTNPSLFRKQSPISTHQWSFLLEPLLSAHSSFSYFLRMRVSQPKGTVLYSF